MEYCHTVMCKECSRLDERISQAGKNPIGYIVQGCAITDYILHRYYDHKIIPLQEKYADLRNGNEVWYDEQIKNGMCDEYQYGVLGRSGPIDPSQFKDMDKSVKAKLQKIKISTDKEIDRRWKLKEKMRVKN